MRRRPAIAAVATLACAVALVSVAGAAGGGGTYKGRTAQKRPVQVAVAARSVTLVRVKIRLRCLDGGVLYDDLSDFQPTDLRSRGRFSDVQYGSTDVVHWRGRVRARSVRGKIRVKDRLRSGVTCDSGFVGFAARPAGS